MAHGRVVYRQWIYYTTVVVVHHQAQYSTFGRKQLDDLWQDPKGKSNGSGLRTNINVVVTIELRLKVLYNVPDTVSHAVFMRRLYPSIADIGRYPVLWSTTIPLSNRTEVTVIGWQNKQSTNQRPFFFRYQCSMLPRVRACTFMQCASVKIMPQDATYTKWTDRGLNTPVYTIHICAYSVILL